jgi:hypothetical protein
VLEEYIPVLIINDTYKRKKQLLTYSISSCWFHDYFFDAKTVGKAPTAPFFIFIKGGIEYLQQGRTENREIRLQQIEPVLHAFFQARFNPVSDALNRCLKEPETNIKVSAGIVEDNFVSMVP